ncbi:TetR/AcrR family transcriptional regulator [Tropicibacter oceani]|uniref:TetR/AcrR family transcriptional regulator n=1 Tax=Tropicibacter oceani TaxID=3058420 RepID=A0ABY8QLE8_9RHOB|nr:TetR/AcrR family transcriptional regulator [Tropicibacter oceani]WGW04647.1 TetR/AcrR family transcriptional regulator [Tropicibacter oceani]
MARTIAKDHEEKRGQILKSAAKVFATEGFDRASMALLARECGISKANIYHYYESKDAILFDILDTYLTGLRQRICGLKLDGLTAQQRLRRVIGEVLMAYQGQDHEHQVQVNGLGALPEDQQHLLRGYQRDLVRFVGDVIADCAPPGLRDDRAKLRAVTMSVFGMLNWYYMWNAEADKTAREEYAGLVCDLTLNGLTGM